MALAAQSRRGGESLREGLEETLTVIRLGLTGALRRIVLCSLTNPIESALSVTRRVTARVTRLA